MSGEGMNLLRRNTLNEWRILAYGALIDVYSNQILGVGRSSPARSTGYWMETVLIYVQPQLNAVTIKQPAPHALYTEQGRPPGPVSIQTIMDWMTDKWGFTNYSVARSIARRITEFGYQPHRILFNTFDLSTPKGQEVNYEMNRILQTGVQVLLKGWR